LVVESKRVVVIASKDNAHFYRLLGFSEIYGVATSSEALSLLRDLKSRRDVGVVLVEESITRSLGLDFADLNEKGLTPHIVIVPDTREALARDPNLYYRRLVLRVIGYEVSA
jgi:vacuolar-type H+-ATPase subunit F/Vma7